MVARDIQWLHEDMRIERLGAESGTVEYKRSQDVADRYLIEKFAVGLKPL